MNPLELIGEEILRRRPQQHKELGAIPQEMVDKVIEMDTRMEEIATRHREAFEEKVRKLELESQKALDEELKGLRDQSWKPIEERFGKDEGSKLSLDHKTGVVYEIIHH